MRKFILVLLLFTATALTTYAGGYQVGLHSVRNIGMGLIGTSLSYDASTLFYNPGGAPFLKDRFSINGGVSFLMAKTTFQPDGINEQAHLEKKTNFPLYLSAAFKPTNDLSVGITVNTPYGNGLSWGKDWIGRSIIQDLSFRAFTIQPTVAYKFGNVIGIGVGLVYATGSVDLNKAVPLDNANGEGSLNIKGNASNFGFNAGVMVHPIPGLSLGLDYRSKIEMEVKKGDATFTVPASLALKFPNGKVDVMLPLPANLDFGVSYEAGKFMVGINLCYVFWSQYKSLVFTFDSVNATQSIRTSTSAADYEDKLIARVGLQYQVCKAFTARIGGYYDPSPVKDNRLSPQTPSTNQIGMTAGFSVYPVKGFSIDAAFLFIQGSERKGTLEEANFSGTYKNAVFSPSVGLSYSF